MKKLVIGTFAALFLLVGCGQKKETAASTTESSQEALQSTLPVLENATKNTVVTKTLVLPADESGAQQTQIITYKGNQFLSLTIQQKRPVSEDLKNYISERGLDEAKKALKEAEDKDESVQAARKISGFTIETTLLNEKEMETKTSYDFQTLDLKKASENEYLKNVGLENLLKNEPEDYIANRVANWGNSPVKSQRKSAESDCVICRTTANVL